MFSYYIVKQPIRKEHYGSRQTQLDNHLTYSQRNIADAIIIAATLYSSYEFYNAMASLDDVVSSPYS